LLQGRRFLTAAPVYNIGIFSVNVKQFSCADYSLNVPFTCLK
jgi:hypothetical protein